MFASKILFYRVSAYYNIKAKNANTNIGCSEEEIKCCHCEARGNHNSKVDIEYVPQGLMPSHKKLCYEDPAAT